MGLTSRLILLTKGAMPPRRAVGLHRRFYDSDPLSAPVTRVPICHKISDNSMAGFFHITGMGTMTAQERKDFRRVQRSRDIWKKRAVGRGEERRRIRDRRKEVNRSRETWRDRTLSAEHQVAQLESENHQLKNAAMPAPQRNAIDNTNFF